MGMLVPTCELLAEIHAHSVAHSGDQITAEEIDAEIAAYRAEQKALNADSLGRS